MEPLLITQTEYTPEVILDMSKQELVFRGECRPENAYNFFSPIVNWFNNLKNIKPNNNSTPIIFNLDYFNSSSAKHIMNLFLLINNVNNTYNHKLEVIWEYDEDDEDTYDAGLEFEELSGMSFMFKAL